MKQKYIKNIFKDKANSFHQESFEPVEYEETTNYSTKKVEKKKVFKRKKKTENVDTRPFISDDDKYCD